MKAQEAQAGSEALRSLIARRKLMDLLFAITGMMLVAGALTVLVLLFGQLVRDGAARLVATHEVKRDGVPPGRRELVGELKRLNLPDGPQWSLVRNPLVITNAAQFANHLESLRGKPVIAQVDLPDAGVNEIEPTSLTPAADPFVRFDRSEIYGTLERQRGGWAIRPPELPLDLSGVEGSPPPAGARVAIDAGRGTSLPLGVRSVEQLVRQSFFNAIPSRNPERAGIKTALVGSVLVVAVTMLLALPLGIGAGIYLEEYGRKNWLTAIIEINIANLAGVPSIIWGLMALGLFVYGLGLERSILTAGLTLGLLVLPIVIMATREAIRAIPQSIREAAYACGASRWQTTWHHIIPYSLGGILTGTIIGLSRAIGETAPLVTIGALAFVPFLPDFSWSNPLGWVWSQFTVLPIQMFNWISRPDPRFHENAAAAGVVLLALTLSMNALAIYLRYRLRRSIQW
jgi:phosphate transport system permease protein